MVEKMEKGRERIKANRIRRIHGNTKGKEKIQATMVGLQLSTDRRVQAIPGYIDRVNRFFEIYFRRCVIKVGFL